MLPMHGSRYLRSSRLRRGPRCMKLLYGIIALAVATEFAAAETVPLPRPRPAEIAKSMPAAQATAEVELSACRLRLTPVAIASSLPAIDGPGECGGGDIVRLEAIVLADRSKVALMPPATMRCAMAEAVVAWVRDELVEAVQDLGARLAGIDNYASYDCRGRNNVAGAKLSEH